MEASNKSTRRLAKDRLCAKSASTDEGSSSAFARAAWGLVKVLRSFSFNQLADTPDASKCTETGEATFSPPETWLMQHFETMADSFADALAERLPLGAQAACSEPLLLTKAQVAASLQVHPKTLTRWAEEGLLPEPLHIGGAIRWLRTDLEAWFENREWTQ